MSLMESVSIWTVAEANWVSRGLAHTESAMHEFGHLALVEASDKKKRG